MKTVINPEAEHIRTWTVAELPQEHMGDEDEDLPELEIQVGYTGSGNLLKACALDDYVIPLMQLAPKLLAAVHAQVSYAGPAVTFTAEEVNLIERLSGDGKK